MGRKKALLGGRKNRNQLKLARVRKGGNTIPCEQDDFDSSSSEYIPPRSTLHASTTGLTTRSHDNGGFSLIFY